jgi:hypothetical protein
MDAAAPRKPIETTKGTIENERPAAKDESALAKTHMDSILRDPYLSAKIPEGMAPIPKRA